MKTERKRNEKISQEIKNRIAELDKSGVGYIKIAIETGVSPRMVRRLRALRKKESAA